MPLLNPHGTRLRYRESGARRPGAPLLFIHGAGASSAIWLNVMHRLARHRRCVALDLPGHGRSEGTVDSIDEMRDAVGLVAGTLCLGKSVLVGHSMGGVIALSAALAWPDKVAALVLVASSGRILPSAPFLSILEHEWAHWPSFLAEGGYSPETPRERRRRSASIACAAEQAQTRRDYAALAATDLRGKLGEIAVPTIVVSGAHDLMVPAKHGAATAAAIPGARHVVIPRCGHFPMHEAPEPLVEILRAVSPAA